ncbi:nitroreductase family protein [Hungatella hathewayi]|uniref:nitroreductase family protein n=1 Tax=Hungatella hathewayi TaxID=154046 RepID=UPI00210CEA52|nr:nitroreductase family protein [Hungatella hathewayi]MCQ5386703.1 nitroreductase family protein [Hungatella hathewayi]
METMKAIAKRKSTRAFMPDQAVAEPELDAILAAGCAAPVGAGDYSSLHLTVVQNPETLSKISEAVKEAFHMDRDVLYGAPVLVLVSSSEPKFPNIQYANVGCVMENMLLAATDLGVDNIYLWGAVNVIANMPELQKELGIPGGFTPISGAALGYAAEDSQAEKKLEITLAINYAP